MKKIYFKYRPDGDLNEIIGNDKAKQIVRKCREFRYSTVQEIEEKAVIEIAKTMSINCENFSDLCDIIDERNDNTWQEIGEILSSEKWKKRLERKKRKVSNRYVTQSNYVKGMNYNEMYKDYIDKEEGITVRLTNKLLSSTKVMEGASWGGVSSDMCEAWIEYPDDYDIPVFVGKNESQKELSETFEAKGITYKVEDMKSIEGFNTHNGKVYTYTKNKKNMYAYEVSMRISIDDYVIISVVFENEPSLSTVREKLYL